MSGQVILYFDDQADALRFALAAGSVMAGDEARATGDLVHETTRVTRILLDDPNPGKRPQPNPPIALPSSHHSSHRIARTTAPRLLPHPSTVVRLECVSCPSPIRLPYPFLTRRLTSTGFARSSLP